MQQANSTVEEDADPRKYEVGARLRFLDHNDHIISVFEWGDLLIVEPRNGCGMGIDVRRESDNLTDMVWPDEVDLLGADEEHP